MGSAAAPKAVEIPSPVAPLALTVQGNTVSYEGISATFGTNGLAVQVDDPSLITINGQRVSLLPAEAANGNMAGAKRYATIEEEVKARGLKKDDLMEDGWRYGGISKSTGTHCAFGPQLMFDGAGVTWHQAVEYKPDRVTFGYKDSVQRIEKDVQDASKDDGGVRPMTIAESEDIQKLPSAKKIVGSRWCWLGAPCYQYGARIRRFGVGDLSYGSEDWREPVALPFRSDPRQRGAR